MNPPLSDSPALPIRRTNRRATVLALGLATFMAAMEMTVVSTAMPTVVAELGGALQYAWVFSAYMLTATVMVPINGKLADLYGRKPVLFAAIALFLFGSMASGQARSMTALIVFRAIQGIGAGGIQPISMTILGDIFDVEERGRVQGIFGAVWGAAGLAGPLLGGIIVATLSWRWIFYINVPFGILAGLVLWFSLAESVERKRRELDILGATLLSSAVVALLLGVEGILPWLLLPAALVLGVSFVVVEFRAREPMLPPRLFKTPAIAYASVLSTMMGAGMIGLLTFIPLYAQGVLGATPTEAGAAIAPMAVAWAFVSAVAGRFVPRFGPRPFVRAGSFLLAVSSLGLAVIFSGGATSGQLRVAAVLFGIGMGLANMALVIAIQQSVTFADRGVATSSYMFFRNIGGTIGVGVMGVVLARDLLANAIVKDAGGAQLVARILGPDRKNIAPSILTAIAGDLQLGIAHVSWVWVGIGVVAVIAAWRFPPRAQPPA